MSSPLPVVPMPDAEQVAVGILAAALDPGVTVGTEWPAKLAQSLPAVAVSLGGGGSRQAAVTADRTLDIDVLAETKGEARDLAALVSAHLIAAQGTVQPGAQIYGVQEVSLIWLPDPVTDLPRYVLVMSLVVRPRRSSP
ncbi:hypothetical protein KVH22_25455 [Streptomyces olivaceus]|uniref:hypothetical protein n=1 Tax=Streptomyces olivaceus TaxID=47716 RepID=UPI001CCD5941|nr:hypothetical protein [Streptomyces olivaceus]MBZ6258866.1 hypothetical protein [Streptomyces olivaceus]